MLAYVIKVYLVDGYWGYYSNDDLGGFQLTKTVSNALCFTSISEAKAYYNEHIKYGDCNGVAVDTSKTSLVSVNY